MTISAQAVKALREKTGLPMMDCKQALTETGGNEEAAIKWLREQGKRTEVSRSGRETAFGRMGTFIRVDPTRGVGAMVELKCESAPVSQNDEFIRLANNLAEQLATGPGAASAEELLDQPSPGYAGTLRQQKEDLFNRIREVFNVGRIVRIDGSCSAYTHNASTISGVLLQFEGTDEEAARNVSMHIAAMRPQALDKDALDPAIVEQEREVLTAAARNEGKPENIIPKMVEGRLKSFFAESTLLEQPYVKDNAVSVGQYATNSRIKLVRFVHWELGG